MPLHLKLRRGEKLLVNGAVLEMGPRYGEILVHNQSHCLREGELLREEQATTPTRRVYFQIQMMIVDPAAATSYREQLEPLLTALEGVMARSDMVERLRDVRREVDRAQPYRALALLRAVLKYEDLLLSAVRLEEAREAERLAHLRTGNGVRGASISERDRP